jgi:hypothetical protein
MMAGIMEMGMGGENSDVEIIVEGQSFPCHKLLLAAGISTPISRINLPLLPVQIIIVMQNV